MPTGIPVATVAVNGAANAAILAVQILALEEPGLADKLAARRTQMEKKEQLYQARPRRCTPPEIPRSSLWRIKTTPRRSMGSRRGPSPARGAINNRMSNFLMGMLEKHGVPTHLVEELSDRETAVKKVSIVPLEVIIRNISAGSFCQALRR